MNLPGQTAAPTSQSGFSLVEILVAAVIFSGVFLLLFAMLGRVLSNSRGADELRAASIADIRLAQFHAGHDYSNGTALVELDGIRFQVTATTETKDQMAVLRLTICRENTNDTVATFYGIRYVQTD